MYFERFRVKSYKLLMINVLLVMAAFSGEVSGMSDSVALYFSFNQGSIWPTVPSSLLIQSPSYIKVPAGAVLKVHLMRDGVLVATSKLTFQQPFQSDALIPPVPVASFIPEGGQPSAGQPLPGASLIPGSTDLTKIAQDPSKYRLMWVLSTGVMGTPGRAIATGSILSLIDLNYSAVSSASIMGDQKPGSILFFNRYSSSASNPLVEDTRLSIANTNPIESVYIRMFLVDSATCQVTNMSFCLAPQQSFSLQMSDLDPGVKGYVMAVAVNANGEPAQFNWLVGNAIVKQPASNIGRPYASVLSAYAVARRKNDAIINNNGLAEMIFNDDQYDRLPGEIAFDSVPSQANTVNSTILSLYRPLTDMTGGASSIGVQLTGWGMDSQNQVVSSTGSLSLTCYRDFSLASLRLSPIPIGQFLPSGTTAWFIATSNDLLPLMGVQLNSGDYNSGSNARSLNFSAEYRIKIPVLPVTCGQ